MKRSRRQAMRVSGSTLASLSLGLDAQEALAQAPQAPPPFPEKLVEPPLRNIAPIPLLPDGSAPEHPPSAAGTISEPYLWRYTKGQPPEIDFDYRRMKIKVDTRGLATRSGTVTFADLEALPRHSAVTLLQCGAPNPRGIVKWTGVRFSDVAKMLGVQPVAHYVRLVSSDRYYLDEDINTLMHPRSYSRGCSTRQPIPPRRWRAAAAGYSVPLHGGLKAVTDLPPLTDLTPPPGRGWHRRRIPTSSSRVRAVPAPAEPRRDLGRVASTLNARATNPPEASPGSWRTQPALLAATMASQRPEASPATNIRMLVPRAPPVSTAPARELQPSRIARSGAMVARAEEHHTGAPAALLRKDDRSSCQPAPSAARSILLAPIP